MESHPEHLKIRGLNYPEPQYRSLCRGESKSRCGLSPWKARRRKLLQQIEKTAQEARGAAFHLSRSSSAIRKQGVESISTLPLKPEQSAFYSVQFSRSAVSDSLWPHGLQHARPPCPSPTPGVYSNSCPSSRWHHPTISSSVLPFSSLQSFPASGSFPISQFFRWPKYWSFSFSISPSNE